MKRFMKKTIGTVLSLALVMLLLSAGTCAASDSIAEDGSFEGDVWSDGNWWFGTSSGDWWDLASIQTSEDAASDGSIALNIYLKSEGSVTVNQTLSGLTAGTYELTYDYMGGWDTVAISITASLSGASGSKVTTGGWGDFSSASDTLTVSSDADSATLTLTVSGAAEAWGYLDNISLVKTEEDSDEETEEEAETETSDEESSGETSDSENEEAEESSDTESDTEGADASSDTEEETSGESSDETDGEASAKLSEYVVNGGFETDNIWTDDTAWTFDSATWTAINKDDDSRGTMKISQDAAHTGTSSLQYWFYTGDDGDAPGGDVLIYQTIAAVSAGTYYLSGWTMGGEGCGIEISINGVTVSAENAGWENWVKTNVGTVTFEEASDSVVLTVKITGKAGDWGYIDDISLVPADKSAKTADSVNPCTLAIAGGVALLLFLLPAAAKRKNSRA